MVSMACIILVLDVYLGARFRNLAYILSQLTLVALILVTILIPADTTTVMLSGTFIRDSMGDVLKIFIYLVTMAVFVYSREYLRVRNLLKGEFFVLSLFGVLGMMVMVSAHSMLTLYLGLELLSLCLYAMVALKRDSITVSEAAMKYFVLGALASGMLLYGMSLLYGTTGSLDLAVIGENISKGDVNTNLVFVLGLVFVIVGIGFKLGAVPFHMWIPDVYHGAPTAITLYIGAAPKIAAFAMVMRLLVEGLGALHVHWQDMLIVLSILSLAVGNIVAIAQTNLKRMLAYSTISHVGFLLLGILAGTKEGYTASMFYVIVYALMSVGSFGMILLLSRAGFEADTLEDFRGLNTRSPWYAFMMLILMFSMAGVPPMVGFWAKLSVLKAVVHADLVWLAAVAVLFSIIGAFYYLRVIKLMYFDQPEDNSALEVKGDMQLAISLNGLAVLLLGIFPGALLALCASALA